MAWKAMPRGTGILPVPSGAAKRGLIVMLSKQGQCAVKQTSSAGSFSIVTHASGSSRKSMNRNDDDGCGGFMPVCGPVCGMVSFGSVGFTTASYPHEHFDAWNLEISVIRSFAGYGRAHVLFATPYSLLPQDFVSARPL
jgi:hypothetical protein